MFRRNLCFKIHATFYRIFLHGIFRKSGCQVNIPHAKIPTIDIPGDPLEVTLFQQLVYRVYEVFGVILLYLFNNYELFNGENDPEEIIDWKEDFLQY